MVGLCCMSCPSAHALPPATDMDTNAIDQLDLQKQRDHGHYFNKKTFRTIIYCHHCCDKLWGTGYICEVCNFTCHEKCLKTVASYCSSVALQQVKNPVAHCWSDPSTARGRLCSVCRKRCDNSPSVECEVCVYYVHVDCQDLAVSNCREASTYVANAEHEQHHHWREGNLPTGSKCLICRKSCWSNECLAGMRCEWCSITAHAICLQTNGASITSECDFGSLAHIMLPPNAITVPRTELPIEQLLSIHKSGPSGQTDTATEGAGTSMATHEAVGDNIDDTIAREKDDYEYVHVFDGDTSFEANKYRTIGVPKTSTLEKMKESSLRAYHIADEPTNYYLTQLVHNATCETQIAEEVLADPNPLRNLYRPEGRRGRIFLRYSDPQTDTAKICIYGSWLRCTMPITYCTLMVTEHTTVADVLREALRSFALDADKSNDYNLVEVSLDVGVCERVVGNDENMLHLYHRLRHGSLRRFRYLRFYVQEKEDPHGANVQIFVSNLPPNQLQRQYERMLLRLLGANERPFTKIGPIYYEYGSLVLTFDTAKAASAAVIKLHNSEYEKHKLLVMCLPNIQPQMIPSDVEPLMVLVNVKSGGCQGESLIRGFRKLLNPFQVFDVLKGGPLVGLHVFRNMPKYKILACGGDGTVGWVLNCLDIVKQDSACFLPPCGITPLGTGNDLARVLRWGGGAQNPDTPVDILKDVIEAEEIELDRWTVVFHQEERLKVTAPDPMAEDDMAPAINPEDQTSLITMNNYFGIGIDADVCLEFGTKRDANPHKFTSRNYNKIMYTLIGLEKMIFKSKCRDLYRKIEVEVDGKQIDLPPLEGILILNIMSWASGCNAWGTDVEARFTKPSHHDRKLEVIGLTGVTHLAKIQSRTGTGIRLAQGGSIRITTHSALPVQVDGEPQMAAAGTIVILKSALKATMLKKAKKPRKSQIPATPPQGIMSSTWTPQQTHKGNSEEVNSSTTDDTYL